MYVSDFYGTKQNNPACSELKTFIVNNFNPLDNCEKDKDQTAQSLKQMVSENNEISAPVFTCEIDHLLNVITQKWNNENSTVLNAD